MSSTVFVFYNPTSGGNAGSILKSLNSILVKNPKTPLTPVTVHLHNITSGESGKKEGFLKLKGMLGLDEKSTTGTAIRSTSMSFSGTEISSTRTKSVKFELMRVLVAGGDGTIFWLMSECLAHGISPEQIAIGVIPFGTGNDFSRVTGWGKGFSTFSFQMLEKAVLQAGNATIQDFDLFRVVIQLRSDGFVSKIKGTQKEVIVEGNQTDIEKVMGNYFSLGVESRVGLGFDRHRTKSAFFNKVVYLCEGTKKTFKMNTKLAKLIDKIELEGKEISIKEKMASLICINIPSITGGVDIWKKTKRCLSSEEAPTLKNVQQNFGDGKFEIISMPSLFSFARSHLPLLGINAGLRIGQTGEDFKILFKEDLDIKQRVYMQIDGEFFQLNRPAEICLQKYHKFQVLINNS
jgi:diacylglycerol kinase (ATP)